MKISQRFAFSLLMCAGVMFAAPFAAAQEGMRPVGQLTYTPEPAEMQTGVFQLRPEDRMIRSMRIEVRGGTVDIQSVRLIYRGGEQERYRIRERLTRPNDRDHPQAEPRAFARGGSELHSAGPGDAGAAGRRRPG